MNDRQLMAKLPFLHGSDVVYKANDPSCGSSYPFDTLDGATRGLAGGDLRLRKLFKADKQFNGYDITSRGGDGQTMIIEVNDFGLAIRIRPRDYSSERQFFDAMNAQLKAAQVAKANGENVDLVSKEKKEAVIAKGKEYTMSTVVQPNEAHEDDVNLFVDDTESLQNQFSQITGNISSLTTGINEDTILGDLTTISESFKKTKAELLGLASTPSKNTFGSFGRSVSKMVKENRFLKGMASAHEDSKTLSKSVQENIDYLFGLVHIEYEKLVSTGESLQHTKIGFKKQIAALEELSAKSAKSLEIYKEQSDIPMREVLLNTQIATSAEKYRQRLIKIEGAIMATQHTIMVLGKELPAQKSDLIDEMAIGSLLGSVDKYQKMYGEIAELVGSVTENTAAATHEAVENLLELQINDTHTIEYIQKSAERGTDFKNMIVDKLGRLNTKIHKDAEILTTITSSDNLLETKQAIEKIGYTA